MPVVGTMTKFYITFSGRGYNDTTKKIVEGAPRFGADQVLVYDDLWLTQTEFYRMNQWLWQCKGPGNLTGGRGFGWFCWKPFVILDCLERFMEPGDIVLYTDADTYPIADFSVLYDECARANGVMLFRAEGWLNRPWCKRDTAIVMAQDFPEYYNAPHAVARFMLFQKGSWQGKQLLIEWLTYCLNPLANTFDESILGEEIEGFRESRTEQLILSLLATKHCRKLYREACQFGDAAADDRDLYPTLFHQGLLSSNRKDLSGSDYRNVPELK